MGKLVEALAEGGLLNALESRGIKLNRTLTNVQSYSSRKEFDIIAVNGQLAVVVEVKTTLRLKDVKYFLEKMKDFKSDCPEYKPWKIYGAVAYIKSYQKARQYAEEKGLFVIKAVGNSSVVVNASDFQPKELVK